MTPLEEYYHTALTRIVYAGYQWEIDYVKSLKPPEQQTPDTFFSKYLWSVLDSGKKEQVVRIFFNRFNEAMQGKNTLENSGFERQDPFDTIPIRARRTAAREIYKNRELLFQRFLNAKDRIEFLDSLPFIGKKTKYLMARNLGIDTIKPDLHLIRMAEVWGYKNPFDLCNDIQHLTGERLGVIDLVLWRYCNLTGDYGKWLKDRENMGAPV